MCANTRSWREFRSRKCDKYEMRLLRLLFQEAHFYLPAFNVSKQTKSAQCNVSLQPLDEAY